MSDAAFRNRIAEKYSRGPIKDGAAYEATLARVTTYLQPEDRVLEPGCGTGGTARRLAPLVASVVTATDISEEMIRIDRAGRGHAGPVRGAPRRGSGRGRAVRRRLRLQPAAPDGRPGGDPGAGP